MRIQSSECTPFLGAGAAAAVLPTARQIASEWSAEYHYPYPDSTNLGAVAQFITDSSGDRTLVKQLIVRCLTSAPPGSAEVIEPYGTLARLPFRVYVTTNYDDLLAQALRHAGRTPRVEVCRWNRSVREALTSVFDTEYEPSPSEPAVYHLHGHISLPESLVLTDDDYLDFLLTAFSDRALIPPPIQEAIAGRSLLFIGYRLYDWNFRMLFRRFSAVGLQRANFAVLRPPDLEASSGDPVAARLELEAFHQQVASFTRLGIQPFLGTAQEFAVELRRRALVDQRSPEST
jgi:hypothetical protein